MTIDLDLAKGIEPYDDEERMWAENEMLIGNRELIVHSNEIGNIGEITKVINLKWLDEDSDSVK